MSKINKLQRIHTSYVWINPKSCISCWQCIDNCPQDVIGKVGILWHKHIIIQNADDCIGCKKCINCCPAGVFSENMPDIVKSMLKR